MPDPSPETITRFILRWEKSGGSEKANHALFFTELWLSLNPARGAIRGSEIVPRRRRGTQGAAESVRRVHGRTMMRGIAAAHGLTMGWAISNRPSLWPLRPCLPRSGGILALA